MAGALWLKGSLWGTGGGAVVLYDPRKEAASDVLISSFFADSLHSQSAPTTCRVLDSRAGYSLEELRTKKHNQALEEHGLQCQALSIGPLM